MAMLAAFRFVALTNAQVGPGGTAKDSVKSTSPKSGGTESGKATKKKSAKARPLDPIGRPEGSIIDQPARWYVWFDDREKHWCLRSTTGGKSVPFAGVVTIEGGRIESCVGVGFKTLKGKKEKDNEWRMSADRKTLNLNWVAAGRSDGVNVKVSGEGATLRFDLKTGGASKPEVIFVGASKGHPAENPFELPANPESTADAKPPAKKAAKKGS
jgi:hypothetical protein